MGIMRDDQGSWLSFSRRCPSNHIKSSNNQTSPYDTFILGVQISITRIQTRHGNNYIQNGIARLYKNKEGNLVSSTKEDISENQILGQRFGNGLKAANSL